MASRPQPGNAATLAFSPQATLSVSQTARPLVIVGAAAARDLPRDTDPRGRDGHPAAAQGPVGAPGLLGLPDSSALPEDWALLDIPAFPHSIGALGRFRPLPRTRPYREMQIFQDESTRASPITQAADEDPAATAARHARHPGRTGRQGAPGRRPSVICGARPVPCLSCVRRGRSRPCHERDRPRHCALSRTRAVHSMVCAAQRPVATDGCCTDAQDSEHGEVGRAARRAEPTATSSPRGPGRDTAPGPGARTRMPVIRPRPRTSPGHRTSTGLPPQRTRRTATQRRAA